MIRYIATALVSAATVATGGYNYVHGLQSENSDLHRSVESLTLQQHKVDAAIDSAIAALREARTHG
jgi:hypothetical protein